MKLLVDGLSTTISLSAWSFARLSTHRGSTCPTRPLRHLSRLLALAHLRCGHTHAQLAAGFDVETATVHRYIAKVVEALTAVAPDLAAATLHLATSNCGWEGLRGGVVLPSGRDGWPLVTTDPTPYAASLRALGPRRHRRSCGPGPACGLHGYCRARWRCNWMCLNWHIARPASGPANSRAMSGQLLSLWW